MQSFSCYQICDAELNPASKSLVNEALPLLRTISWPLNVSETMQTLEIFGKMGIEIGEVLRKISLKQKINQKTNCSADSRETLADSSASIGPGHTSWHE